MKSVQQEVDERSNLTNSNKFELLLFRLGGDANGEHSELFGINVFKIRVIVAMPEVPPCTSKVSPSASAQRSKTLLQTVKKFSGRDAPSSAVSTSGKGRPAV